MHSLWIKAGVILVAVVVSVPLIPLLFGSLLRLASNGVARLRWWWNGGQEESVYPCPVCGYDIRATPHRCPECGTKLMWGLLPGKRDRR